MLPDQRQMPAIARPARRWLLHGVVFLLLTPLLWAVLFQEEFGLAGVFGHPERLDRWTVGVLAGYLLAIVAVLKWGALRVAAALLLVSLYGQYTLVPVEVRAEGFPADTILEIGNFSEVPGIDVWCNDVWLGRTPLEIRRSEFLARVPFRTVPPRQPRVKTFHEQTRGHIDLAHARFTFTPGDPFRQLEPGNHLPFWWGGWEATVQKLPSAGYWWRYEKQGCIGLATMEGFDGGGSAARKYTNPHIEFPSNDPHWKLLQKDLERSDFHPSEEWMAHAIEWSDLLRPKLFDAAYSDERYRPILDELTRRKTGLDRAETSADYRRIRDELLATIEERVVLREKTLEADALSMIARRYPHLIIEAYLAKPLIFNGSELTRGGAAARRFALELAIAATTPPELLERIRTQEALLPDQHFLRILMNYELNDAVPEPLREAVRKRLRRLSDDQATVVLVEWIAALADDPAQWNTALERMSQLRKDQSSTRDAIVRFVRKNRNAPPERLAELVDWIRERAPLPLNQRARLLVSIPSPQVPAALTAMRRSIELQDRREMIEELIARPNPYCDEFLLASWDVLRKASRHTVHTDCGRAILATDSPTVREWIRERAERFDKEWSELASSVGPPVPHLAWLVPQLAERTKRSDRGTVVRLLAAIDTPEAWDVLNRWSEEGDKWISQRVAQITKERDRAQAALALEQQQISALLSGRLRPDDLLPPGKAYVWTGTAYVPEVPEPLPDGASEQAESDG